MTILGTEPTTNPQRSGGAFVCIVGPSGAGKDSLLAHARKGLIDDGSIAFPRRLVTRSKNDAEDHDTITQEAFDAGVAAGEFCLHWQAHGLSYALPHSVADAVSAGQTVVCNVSRSVIPQIVEQFARVYVVQITAPTEVITERLLKRGRETVASIAARQERNRQLSVVFAPDLTIMNTGSLEAGGEQLIGFLRGVAKTRDDGVDR